MTREEIIEMYPEEEFIFYDEFDEAIIGVSVRIGMDPVVNYDGHGILAILTEEGLTLEEAMEHMDYNIIGGWIGEKTPLITWRYEI